MTQMEKIQQIRKELTDVMSRSISRADSMALTRSLELLNSLEQDGAAGTPQPGSPVVHQRVPLQ